MLFPRNRRSRTLPSRHRLRSLASGRRLGKAKRHVLQQKVGEDVSRCPAPAIETGRAPEGLVLRRAVADGVFVLLVEADERAGLDVMLAEDLRVVVLQDEQVLVVVEGRLVSQGPVSAPSPPERVTDVRPVLFALDREDVWNGGDDTGIQLRVSAMRRTVISVGRGPELKTVRRVRSQASGSAT